jgi:hypothetical protein
MARGVGANGGSSTGSSSDDGPDGAEASSEGVHTGYERRTTKVCQERFSISTLTCSKKGRKGGKEMDDVRSS